ncbi:hypothetical protein ACR9E3_16725 [Actinomycetospora sp. C-140]
MTTTDPAVPVTVTRTVEVTELRVHGVHGTPPSALLGDPYPEQVAGDSDARFYRRRGDDGNPRREAFWWAHMTSGSPLRAFWLLFLPFALVNLARFALLTWDDARDGEAPALQRRVLDRIAGGLLRLIGAVMTLGLVITTFGVCVDLVVRQCAMVADCRDDFSWLNWLESWDAGPALVLAALPAALVLGLFEYIGRQTYVRSSPDDPPMWSNERRFGDQGFWREAAESTVLRRLHLGVCAAVVGVLAGAVGSSGATAMTVIGLVILGVVLVLVAFKNGGRSWRFATRVAAAAGVYMVVAVGLAARDGWSGALVATGEAPAEGLALRWQLRLPDALELAINLVGVGLAALLLVFVVVVLVQARRFRRDETRAANRVHRPVPCRPDAFRPMWGGMAPVVLVSLGMTLFFAYATGIVFAIADLLGTVRKLRADQEQETFIQVGSAYWSAALGALAAAVIVAVCVAPLAAWVLGRLATAITWLVACLALGAGVVLVNLGGVLVAVGEALIGLAVVGIIVGAVLWVRAGRRPAPGSGAMRPDDDYPVPTPAPPSDLAESSDKLLNRIWRAWLMGRAKFRYRDVAAFLATVGALTILTGGAVAVPRLWGSTFPAQPTLTSPAKDWVGMAGAAGAALAGALLLALLSLGITTYRSQAVRTTVGIAWDLISFWPRLVHPLCPPPYGGRAVIETAARATYLVTEKDTQRVVVLSGHSQGSVICMAAATLLAARADRFDEISQRPPMTTGPQPEITLAEARATVDRLALLSYGSQLQWAFPRLFPCFIGFHHLKRLYETGLEGRWRSLYRETDPLGGRVLSWHGGPARGLARDGQGFLSPARIGAAERWGPDVRLRDPITLAVLPTAVRPHANGHSDYYDDPAFERVLAEVAEEAGATPWATDFVAERGASEAAEFRS